MKIAVLDKTFEKLLAVVPCGLTRDKTRAYLSEYQYREISEEEGIITDFYFRPDMVPTQSMQVLFRNDHPYYSLIALIYPICVSRFIAKLHRKQQFGKLRHILTKQFGSPKAYSGFLLWTKSHSCISASVPGDDGRGKLSIEVKSYDTNVISFNSITCRMKFCINLPQ